MKSSHIFWGTLFISLGVLILLNNFDWLSIDWSGILKLWPFVFILWGLSILAKGDVIKSIITGVVALLLALVVFSGIKTVTWAIGEGVVFYHDDDEDYSGKDVEVNTYFAEYTAGTETASLNFDAGAGTFILRDTTDKLFSALTKGINNNYDLYSTSGNEEAKVRFKMKDTRIRLRDGKLQNKVEMKLNPLPVWQLYFDVGAASADIDLSKFKISRADLDMGAASLNLKLGKPEGETEVSIDAGASSIDVDIPANTACEVRLDAALSSKSLSGFDKIDDNLYRTPGFYDAKEKIILRINSGVSSIDVNTY